MRRMIQKVTQAGRVKHIHTGFQLIRNRKSMWCMIKDIWRGHYKLSFGTSLLLVLGVLYIVLPFDFDWIPFIGWIDDAAVAFFLIKLLQKETNRYVRAKVMERKGF